MLDVTRAYGLDFLFPEKDRAIGAALRSYGEFARAELDLICACLERSPPGAAYVDVGANIGSIALPVAARFPNSAVIAIEAHRGLSNVLAANALNNRLFNVQVLQAAVGDSAGLVRFPSVPLWEDGNFGLLGIDAVTQYADEAVRMCTVDEVAPAATRVVKIDVEGFEAKVLAGAEKTLREARPAWILEIRPKAEDTARSCMKTLLEAGYQLFLFPTPFVLAQPLKQAAPAPSLKLDVNLLALPPGLKLDWNLLPIDTAEPPWGKVKEAFRYAERYQSAT